MMDQNHKIIRARAPLRLGLAGGGTDVSPYCDQFGGLIVNTTIDRYAYAVIKKLPDQKVKLISSDHNISIEKYFDKPFSDEKQLLLHQSVYRHMIKEYNKNRDIAIELSTFCDAPAGSGLGSSSTLVVSMIKAFLKYFNVEIDNYNIAKLAYKIERVECQLGGGKQDQYSATFGGFNYMEFGKNGDVIVTPILLNDWVVSELEASLLLFYSGVSRSSAAIISEQSQNVESNNTESIKAMHAIKEEALLMKSNLLNANFSGLIESMQIGWQNKKKIAKNVSNEYLDQIFDKAIEGGASAGKISGAGGGGFFMFFVPTENRMNVVRVLSQFDGQISNCHFTNKGAEAWTL
jgi:D-glycero-alpha-D-manno-heptose-7-phosphate kinase